MRKAKGVTVEQAREIMYDATYFGTMLVHNGMVDGMVSGAAHTTAHTVRPAFEIIKTVPDVSTVSSVFFMCLPDRVLAYGDCAIVPNPTPEQLADIAISSARTAAQFGIEPRVAMLSYSTGDSGTGADVDKVRAATELVRCPGAAAAGRGPIQYDAAIEPSVAATKMRDSPVAGRATVLIFPDLNTGNNTYKAVQRSAGAIAIGPVLQGLRKPVNDLSRGALVEDIVNTVAITAIQAQGDPWRANTCVLVINSGSSSLKYQLVEPDSGIARGVGPCRADRRGIVFGSPTTPRRCGRAFERVGRGRHRPADLRAGRRSGIGWCTAAREFYRPTLLDDAVIAALEKLSELAPLHNPPALKGIEVARKLLPDVPHVAVFDTAFFHDLPPAAATYAIDREIGRSVADPPLRVSRHLAPLRQRAGRRLPGQAAGRAESDCAASG